MSEHLLFLQAAGSDFSAAHELVAAVTDVIRAGHDEGTTGDVRLLMKYPAPNGIGLPFRRPGVDPEQLAQRVEGTGCKSEESLLVALAAHATVAAPLNDVDLDWISSAAARVDDADLVLEAAGVVFAFNAINRVADARRVRLEYRLLRELKPIRGWVERRLASLIGLAYDLSYRHHPRHSPAELLERLGVVFERLGAAEVPEVFHWLSQSPVVLEGIVEMLEANVLGAGVHFDLLKEAAAVAVMSRAMPGSSLSRAFEQWLPQESLPDGSSLQSRAAGRGGLTDSDLASECRRYAWRVANAAYTISDEQIGDILALGLSDAELLDLTLATSLFSALAIIEPISAALAPGRWLDGRACGTAASAVASSTPP